MKRGRNAGSKNWDMLKQTISTTDTIKRTGKRRKRSNMKHGKEDSPVKDSITLHSAMSSTETPCMNLSTTITQRLALDCEMVAFGKDATQNQLARVSIVNVYGEAVYDKIVKPREPITDFRTHITGLTREIISRHGHSFKLIQKEVSDLLKDRIVIGHDVKHDFNVLGFSHPRFLIRDTAKYKPFRELAKGNTPSLKKLCLEILKTDIQQGEHNSIEDARSALLLYRKHRAAWERSLKKKKKTGEAQSAPSNM